MRKTSIGIGVIIALVLLYSCPAFAEDESLGAKGMLSSREMRAINNAGGTIGASRSDMGAAPANVNINGKTMTVNEVKGVIGHSFSNSDAGKTFRANAAAGTTPENFRNNSNFGLGRGHSEATGAAVTALKAYAPPSSPVSPASQTMDIGGKKYDVKILGVMHQSSTSPDGSKSPVRQQGNEIRDGRPKVGKIPTDNIKPGLIPKQTTGLGTVTINSRSSVAQQVNRPLGSTNFPSQTSSMYGTP